MREYIGNVRIEPGELKSVFDGFHGVPLDKDGRDIRYWVIKTKVNTYDYYRNYYKIGSIQTDGKTIWNEEDISGRVDISFFFCVNGDAEQEFLNELPSQELRDKYYVVQACNLYGYGERNPTCKIYRFGKGREVVEL